MTGVKRTWARQSTVFLAGILAVTLLFGGCGAGAGQKDDQGAEDGSTIGELHGIPLNGDGQDSSDTGTDVPYAQPDMEGEITVSVMFGQEFLTAAAESFMKEYPDVRVTIHVGIDDFTGTGGQDKIEDYRTLLNTKIMSGKAEDIIFTTELPVQKYMDIGAFADLSGYVSQTPEMNEENYFMNVLTSARDGQGNLYLLPYKCSFWTFGYDRQLSQGMQESDGGSIRFSEAVSRAKQLADRSTLPNTFLMQNSPTGYMQRLVEEYQRSLIDMEAKKANINTGEYIGWLKEVKELYAQGYFNMDRNFNYYNTEYHFAMQEDFDMQAAFYNLAPDSDTRGMLPVADAEGNVYTSYSGFFGISSSSRNKALAWEFMKYVLSPQVQSLPSLYGLAVSREGFQVSVKRQYSFYEGASSGTVSQEEYGELLAGWMSRVNKCNTLDPIILDFFGQENQKFFDGLQSAEETAEAIQNKVAQYLSE